MHKHMSPHGDYDHMEEAIKLVEKFKIENVILNLHYNNIIWINITSQIPINYKFNWHKKITTIK